VLYIVHFTAFCLGGRFYPDTVYNRSCLLTYRDVLPVAGAGKVQSLDGADEQVSDDAATRSGRRGGHE